MAFSKIRTWLLVFSIGLGGVSAAGAEETISADPAMWRTADADTEVYFLGTFHILPKGVDWRTPTLETVLDNATTVYFEVDADSPDAQSKTLSVLMTQGFNGDGVMLTDLLSTEDAGALREIATSVGLPFEGVNPMRPWNAFLTLSVQFIIQQGFDPGSGVDSVLIKETRTRGQEQRFFESIEDQLGFFTGLSPAAEKNLLELTIRDWDNQAQSFDDLFRAWREGDANYIDTEMNTLMRDQAPDVYERLIVGRNTKWTEEIARVMEEETGVVLVAVGAAHLVGAESVPTMLENRGFVVERVGGSAANQAPSSRASSSREMKSAYRTSLDSRQSM